MDSGQYDYYFGSERPAFVSRLIAHKQRSQLRRAGRGAVPESVLEVGPGEGWFARACREAGVERYLALEASTVGAERLRAAGFEVRGSTVPPLPDGLERVDLVYASHVVEHLPGPEAVLAFVRDCKEVLKPGGAIALAFPDARRMGVDFWDSDYTHRWPSTPRRMAQVAKDARLQVVAVHHCCLHLCGTSAALVRLAMRFYPYKLLSLVQPSREEFWFRAKMLFVSETLMLLQPSGTSGVVAAHGQEDGEDRVGHGQHE